jgi:hypothetical protein
MNKQQKIHGSLREDVANLSRDIRRETAWWVHPDSGEVIPVRAHSLAVAQDPKKFGISHSQVRKAGADKTFNYYDAKGGSTRDELIKHATANGWVRVRQTAGGGKAAFQVHGKQAERVSKALGHLERRGAKFRLGLTIDDPGHKYNATFHTVKDFHSAMKRGEVANHGGDQSVKSVLRTRVASAGKLADEPEYAPTFSAYEGKKKPADPVVTDDMASKIRARVVAAKAQPNLPQPQSTSADNAPPMVGAPDPTPALQTVLNVRS